MRPFLLVALIITTCTATGCESYRVSSFSSNSADIFYGGYWSTPRYRVLFTEQGIGDERDLIFSSPPQVPMWVGLNFIEDSDFSALLNANAVAHAEIIDESGTTVYENVGPLSRDHSNKSPWRVKAMVALRPPSNWRNEEKGAALDASDFADRGRQDPTLWGVASQGVVVIAPTVVELSSGSYTLRIRITADKPLSSELKFLPMLAGGSRGVL